MTVPTPPPGGTPPQDGPPYYAQQQPQYGPPPGYPVYQPQPPFNTYAIVALILAIAVLPPLGIYFGKKAQQQIAVSGERGIELANAAVIVGWVLSIIMGVFLVIWCAFAGSMIVGFLGIFGAAGVAAGSH